MDRIAHFEKVSFEEFHRAWEKSLGEPIYGETLDDLRMMWEQIKLPTRATSGSAGYDFYIPHHQVFDVHKNVFFPTGIRCVMEPGWVLMLFPKSGLGSKYNMRLLNSVGIVDHDYAFSDNEGHIHAGFAVSKGFILDRGDKYMQGIFLPFGITMDDNATGIRNGGFGSTGVN